LPPGTALLFGSVSAALDSVLPATLARQLTGPTRIGVVEKLLERSGMDKGVLRSTTAGIFKGVGTEGLTEGAQEAISIAAERFIDENPDVFGSKEWERIIESSVRGAVAGSAFDHYSMKKANLQKPLRKPRPRTKRKQPTPQDKKPNVPPQN
jgi:hypothetical protein